ncbi:hypothetical protein M3Y99_00808800 [Aphelenchoides fujianensis]|nr:hypothetical protein M3Y99_00808800 [Aphelenchoides fujianensis]
MSKENPLKKIFTRAPPREQPPMRRRDERTSLNAPAVGVAPPSATQGGTSASVYPPCYYCENTTHLSRDCPTQQAGGSGAGEFLHAEILRAEAATVRAVAAARATTAASRATSCASARTEDVAEDVAAVVAAAVVAAAVAAAAATARATPAARSSAAKRRPTTPSERVGEMC